MQIPEQEYFDNAVLMVAMVKAGVELAFDAMVEVGMKPESAYYESLHETPLIANTIARMKLYEMNSVISDTAEYGCYLYDQACRPLLTDFMKKVDTDVIGTKFNTGGNGVDNRALNAVNEAIRSHPVEVIGKELRGYMTDIGVALADHLDRVRADRRRPTALSARLRHRCVRRRLYLVPMTRVSTFFGAVGALLGGTPESALW